MKVTICASASFYRQVVEVATELEKRGFKVLLPKTAEKMKQSGDYDVSHYKKWFENTDDYSKKGALMRGHFEKIVDGDAILVLNYEKHGEQNYIGGNVLIEMGLAFYLKKPIFIFNGIPEESAFLEEIKGFQPTVLGGNLNRLTV